MLPDRIETSYREHTAIVDTISRRDADGAQGAVESNWRGAAVRLGAVIGHIGERGSW
jgi:DNA-binding FadR family transcriptional regulator